MHQPVLILGAGINGAALARELVLNDVPVCVVDINDIASGTTAYSSRLIHGGLRYLEYGEFDLVRESLDERTRLLRLAPDFVRPLKLFIPIQNRASGFITAMRRFFGSSARYKNSRGLWLVRTGLWLYDRYANDATLPRRHTYRLPREDVPLMNTEFRWACSYYDAQIQYPERFVIALLADARRLAVEKGIAFHVLPYHEASLDGGTATVRKPPADDVLLQFEPLAVVNATGAWVDQTLNRMAVDSRRLIGGTKGSHLLTPHAGLRNRLDGNGVYLEADDGRPIFLLPLGDATLIGTTDLVFGGDPQDAVATEDEIEYLVAAVNQVFPDLQFARDEVTLHYCGVRPLPFADNTTPGAITRRHLLEEHADASVPFYSIVGGKLTTSRSLAEETASTVLTRVGREIKSTSCDRPIHESDYFTVTEQFSDELVRQVVRNEWVSRLGDLVERRLMLLYKGEITVDQMRHLAELLVDEQKLDEKSIDAEVTRVVQRLHDHFGLQCRPCSA